jgi:hypothetical protein
VSSGLVPNSERPGFDAAVTSTKRLRDSIFAEISVILIAYLLAVTLTYSVPLNILPRWFLASPGRLAVRSPAAWWHMLVSLPLLFMLSIGWIWRVMLWARFLWLTSRLNLRLLPSHPDRSGGLRAAGQSLRAFALPAFALSAIVAGGVANRVLHDGSSPFEFRHLILGLVVFVVILFASPLFVFIHQLLTHWHRGVLEYGTLADRVGTEFERDWLDSGKPFNEDPLQTGAFSALTDLYQVVERVYQMRPVPIDLMSMLALVCATLLPFVPVLFLAVPFDVVLEKITGVLF